MKKKPNKPKKEKSLEDLMFELSQEQLDVVRMQNELIQKMCKENDELLKSNNPDSKDSKLDAFEQEADDRAGSEVVEGIKKLCSLCPNKHKCPFTNCGYVTKRGLCNTMWAIQREQAKPKEPPVMIDLEYKELLTLAFDLNTPDFLAAEYVKALARIQKEAKRRKTDPSQFYFLQNPVTGKGKVYLD